jgi:predicted GH43/DUF377 family glycosyl hydrolase
MESLRPAFRRHRLNPIVRPGGLSWRHAATFNPAVVRDDDGTFLMLERSAARLQPFQCVFGLLRSRDGVHWEHASREPVLTPADLGYPHGSLQDPRLVKIDGIFVLVGVLRPWCWDCFPTGRGAPEYREVEYAGRDLSEPNVSRSFIATSRDLQAWTLLGYCSDIREDDRDNILFPEKIQGRYALLRRPLARCGPGYGTARPGIWLSLGDDLKSWDEPRLIAAPLETWESQKIGGSTPPLRTANGWLVLYHGVDSESIYRVGALLLDLNNPARVLARTATPLLEPEAPYERSGLVIPNVVFPSGNVVVGEDLWVYYGACDTAIALATVKLQDLLAHLHPARQRFVPALPACP